MSSIRSELISTILFYSPFSTPIIPYSSPASMLSSLCGEQNLCLPFSSRQDFNSCCLFKISERTVNKSQALFLDQINLVMFPKISANFSLSILLPKWFRSAQIIVWRYTGIDDTSEEILLTQEFANLNFKLDQLLS